MADFDRIADLQPQKGSVVPEKNAGSSSFQVDYTPPPPVQSTAEPSLLRLQKQNPRSDGQKKDPERRPSDIAITPTHQSAVQPTTMVEPASPTHKTGLPISGARRPSSPFMGTISPGATPLRSASPRHLSPATSQIFERDVQESNSMTQELSPAIPAHIQTEDHIPPVLEASSLAITDEKLDPDQVEIVMHSEHRPAAVAVAGNTLGEVPVSAPPPHGELSVPGQDQEDTSSTYGAVDPTDPRRLSFISFADVVHAENVETGKESSHLMSPASMVPSVGGARSPSPSRSPLSDRVPVSPPASGSPSFRANETSPVRGGTASTTSVHGQAHGELTIETMRQTVERTANNEPGLQPSTPV